MVTWWLKCFFTLMVCCVVSWNGVALASVTAHVDRLNISEGETVNLSIKVTGDDSGDPKTAPLQKDFEILSNNHSSSFSIVNGSSSSKSVYQLMLRPRHAGSLTIPAIRVGSAATKPIMMQVSKIPVRSTASGQARDIWIDMEIEPKQLRVQQQAIITLRIYQGVAFGRAQLSEPGSAHAIIERLGEDSTYQKRAGNRIWQVTERRYALLPQQRGHIEIDPVQLEGSVMIGNSGLFQRSRPIHVLSNALSLEVSGIPSGWRGESWLPAKKVRIEESWPDTPAKFRVGEPITRTLTLYADGLSASQLPAFRKDLPDNLKTYPDRPLLQDSKSHDGIHGMRQEKTAIIPMQPGTYILPAINISWWNTETETGQKATLPAHTFRVIAAIATRTPLATTTARPPQLQGAESATRPGHPAPSPWWQWLAIFSLLGWLLTLGWLWFIRKGNRCKRRKTENRDRGSLNRIRKAVKTACNNDDARNAEQTLLHFTEFQFPDMSVHSLTALAKFCSNPLRAEIVNLEKALYASDRSVWHGASLLKAFEETEIIIKADKQTTNNTPLPGLYPD